MMNDPQRAAGYGWLKYVRSFFKWYFIFIGAALTLLGLTAMIAASARTLPDKMILTYTFRKGLVETREGLAFSPALFRSTMTFHDVTSALRAAAKDARVKGVIARLEDVSLSPAQIQELRDTVSALRAAGKLTAVYADDIGGFGSGMGDYYLASSFGQVWLQPVGMVAVNGLAAQVPFFREGLGKLGVTAEFRHKGIYKSMPESLTETGMTPPHREMMTALVEDLSGQIRAGIAADRKLSVDDVGRIVDGSPYSGDEALKLKLVDTIGYYSDTLAAAKAAAGDPDIEDVALDDYHPEKKRSLGGGPSVALIVGAGDIVAHGSQSHVSAAGGNMAARDIVEAFEDAQKDESVKAVVFRIDSPGGSPAAAESIRHAVTETQKKGKPVIVSMGGYAASGGYWVAAPADKIVAEPGTITGSIGVFGGKFVLAQLWQKLGINWESVTAGENAEMWSMNKPFTEAQKARFDALLGDTYEAFITRVMEGRKLTREQVLAAAEGRVWTGRQAKEKKLVDELGGLDTALALAKAAAKLSADKEVPVKLFPAEKSPVEKIMELATKDAGILPAFHLTLPELRAVLDEYVFSMSSIRVR